MKKLSLSHCPTEKLSHRLLYTLVGLTVVVYALFFFVGYNRPWEENPDFKSPLFTDLLLVFASVLTLTALALVIWAAVRDYRRNESDAAVVNGIPLRRIDLFTAMGTLSLSVITLALGSTEPLMVNGRNYTNAWGLRLADMFIFTSSVLLVVAIGAVIYGATRYNRKTKGQQS